MGRPGSVQHDLCICGERKRRESPHCRACYHDAHRTERTIQARFDARVDRSGECWVWTGQRDRNGYGRISFGGRLGAAHRVAWQLATGHAPGSLSVLHHCDNPPCVRPDHLFLGTQADNITDASRKGRLRYGEDRPHRLTAADVRAIRAAAASGVMQKDLSARYGIGSGHVSRIVNGHVWAWLA